MSFYVRRVKRAVWPAENSDLQIALNNFDEMLADPLTDCTKTNNGTLSLWFIDKKEDDKNAIIALLTAPDQKTISAMDIIYIPETKLAEYSLTVENTDGRTTVEELISTHYDIVGVNYKKLQNVGMMILSTLMTTGSRKLTRGEVISIIKTYLLMNIEKNYININENLLMILGEDIQKQLLKTRFYEDIQPKLLLDLKFSVINILFNDNTALIESKISSLNIREKIALRGTLEMQRSNLSTKDQQEISEGLLDFLGQV